MPDRGKAGGSLSRQSLREGLDPGPPWLVRLGVGYACFMRQEIRSTRITETLTSGGMET